MLLTVRRAGGVEAFHYFGLGKHEQYAGQPCVDPGDDRMLPDSHEADVERQVEGIAPPPPLWHWNSPGLWAICAIGLLGAFNLMGPKHTAVFAIFAIFAAVGMIAITLLIVVFAVPQVHWSNVNFGSLNHPPLKL